MQVISTGISPESELLKQEAVDRLYSFIDGLPGNVGYIVRSHYGIEATEKTDAELATELEMNIADIRRARIDALTTLSFPIRRYDINADVGKPA